MRAETPKRVVIVDRIDDERDLFVQVFESAGFAVTLVSVEQPPEMAAAEIAADPPDLVLTRFRPDHFGVLLTEELKQRPETRHVPIIVVTTHIRAETREEAERAGADEVVLLPMFPDAIRDLALKLLSRSQTRTDA